MMQKYLYLLQENSVDAKIFDCKTEQIKYFIGGASDKTKLVLNQKYFFLAYVLRTLPTVTR